MSEVVGKTDEDMHWHVNDGPYKNDEEEVLTEGIHTHNVPGKCIIKGVLHNILASKMPIYRDGKIIGLFGYFIDAEPQAQEVPDVDVTTVDLVTGLSNPRGMIENFISYAEEFKKNGTDFAAIHITIDGYDDFRKEYGEELGDQLLTEISEILLAGFGTRAVIGRMMESKFVALYKAPEQASLSSSVEEIKKSIRGITQIEEHMCTCFPDVSITFAGSSANIEHMLSAVLSGY